MAVIRVALTADTVAIRLWIRSTKVPIRKHTAGIRNRTCRGIVEKKKVNQWPIATGDSCKSRHDIELLYRTAKTTRTV